MDGELRIIILEDRKEDAKIVEHELRTSGLSFALRVVDTKDGYAAELDSFQPDLILADYRLPNFDGMAALTIAKQKSPEIPFIFFSGTIEEDIAIEALKLGATDYVFKERLSRLVPVVTRALKESEVQKTQRQAEKSLRESESKYRRLYDSMMEAFASTDMSGRILETNRAFQTLLGYSEEELKQLNFTDITPEKWHVFESEIVKNQVIPLGYSEVFEKEYRKKEGATFPAELRTFLLRDTAGQPIGMWAIIRDITERKRIEEVLRESEAKFRKIVENTNEGIWTIDGQHRVVFVNRRMASMLGYSPEEMIGRGADSFIFADDLQDHNEKMKRRQRGESAAYERRLRCKEGKSVWCIVVATPNVDAEGRFAGSFAMFTDITERKHTEEKLRLSQARYRTLVENIPQRVLLKDLESNYISINHAYGRAFGLNPEDVSGKSDYDFHPKDLAEKFRQEDRLVMETGESREFEEENVENGNKRILHKVKVPVRDMTGEIIGVLSASSDITERLQLEEQFRHSQKMEAVGRLAGGVAHDFNNLLTVIVGYTEMALTRINNSHPLHDSLQEVKIAADRASSLTRQLLAFSRRQVMEIKVFNLNTVIRDNVKMIRRLLGEDIEILTQLSENTGLVQADPGQISQVLTNLAVNARDAMAEGGRLVIATDTLEISEIADLTYAGLKPGRYVKISVSDTGHGMNPEVMSQIFEPFFTTKEQGKGTGLGLSTVFGIVKQSGGEIRVHSEPEKGTTFGIILPRVEVDEPVIGNKDPKEPLRGTETVLIIEDENSVLQMAAQLLKNQGYKILEASGSEDAMRVFEEYPGPIDLVFTDVVMPVCRGPALVERLKQLRENFKVLYMSGYADGGVGDLGMLRRGDNFIQKPFTLESLTGKVRSILDGG